MNISVVIPTFNRRQTLSRAIDSVISQTSAVDEIIIVDDGSSDDTAAILAEKYPQARLLQQSNQGVSAARNLGIKHAKSDWIALLDSDDSWLPGKIAAIREAAQQYPDIQLFHSDEIWIRNGVRVNAMNKHQKSGGWIFQQCLPLCAISPSATVIKKSLLLNIGLFDESLPACEDYDLWLRICHRYPVHYIDHPLINKFGGHDDQLSRQYWGMDRFRIRALHNLLKQADLTLENKQAVEAMLQYKLDILLKGAEKHSNQAIIDEFEPLLKNAEMHLC